MRGEMSEQQKRLHSWLENGQCKGKMTFDLSEVVHELFGVNPPVYPRTKASSVVRGLARRLEGTGCSIKRTSGVGRGYRAVYEYICKPQTI